MDTPYHDSSVGDNFVENRVTESPKDVHYAGFWMRFWAYIVDVIVVFSLKGLLLSPLKFMNSGEAIQIGYWTVNGLIAALIFFAYFLFMTKLFEQTLGKMIFGLKVINKNNHPLKWSDLLFREVVGRFIYNVIGIMKVLYLVVAFTDEKQGIHDMIGNTRVIHVER